MIGAYVLAGELAAAGGDHDAAFAEYDRVMRPFVDVNQPLGIQSAAFMTQDPAAPRPSSPGRRRGGDRPVHATGSRTPPTPSR